MFHVLIDTSVLRKVPFTHPDFQELLLRSREGKIKIYLPHIVIEERRTQLLQDIVGDVTKTRKAFDDLKRGGMHAMLTRELPEPQLFLWDEKDLDRHSRRVFQSFVEDNKIEVLKLSLEHAERAWERYFKCEPPFDRRETNREKRRKDIPDSWILEAAVDLKTRGGQLCALCDDGQLKAALKSEGFEIFGDVRSLADWVDEALAVATLGAIRPASDKPLRDQLRDPNSEEIRVAILGFVETFKTPTKDDLFARLEQAGFQRRIAEHEAQSLVLLEVLRDSGSHYVPANRALASQAAAEIEPLLLKLLNK